MKIAVLILTHLWGDQQKKLVNILTTKFDVYVHMDKRSGIATSEVSMSGVNAISEFNVYWGHYNQIRATLSLFKEARKNNYDRYILISGQDFPLYSMAEIEDFFDENGKEYFEHFKLPAKIWGKDGGLDRLQYFHPKYLIRGKAGLLAKAYNFFLHALNRAILQPLMITFKKRDLGGITFWGGANWMNLSSNCVNQMLDWLDNNPWYLKRYRFTKCADEIFFHTLILEYLDDLDIVNDNLRYIDWKSGPEYPRVLRDDDFIKLNQSEKIFARKFDSTIDNTIILKIFEKHKGILSDEDNI